MLLHARTKAAGGLNPSLEVKVKLVGYYRLKGLGLAAMAAHLELKFYNSHS